MGSRRVSWRGLIIAEIELPSEDTQFDKPQWLGKEVTQDTTYYNSTLSKTSWKAIQMLKLKLGRIGGIH